MSEWSWLRICDIPSYATKHLGINVPQYFKSCFLRSAPRLTLNSVNWTVADTDSGQALRCECDETVTARPSWACSHRQLSPVHTERDAITFGLLASNLCIFIKLSITSLTITSLSTDVVWWWSPIAAFWPFIVIGSRIGRSAHWMYTNYLTRVDALGVKEALLCLTTPTLTAYIRPN